MVVVCSGDEFGRGVVNIVKCLRVGNTSPALGIGVASIIVTLEEAAWGRPISGTGFASFFGIVLEGISAGCETPQLMGKKLFLFD